MRAQIEEAGKQSDREIKSLPFRDREKTTGIEGEYKKTMYLAWRDLTGEARLPTGVVNAIALGAASSMAAATEIRSWGRRGEKDKRERVRRCARTINISAFVILKDGNIENVTICNKGGFVFKNKRLQPRTTQGGVCPWEFRVTAHTY